MTGGVRPNYMHQEQERVEVVIPWFNYSPPPAETHGGSYMTKQTGVVAFEPEHHCGQ